MSRPWLSARLLTVALAAGAVPATPLPAAAQARTQVVSTNVQDARETRDQFRSVLQLYAPALAGILKLDPSLMTNEAYMSAYPAVGEFLKAHPEVTRDPAYFLSFVSQYGNLREEVAPELQARRDAVNLWGNTLEGLTFFSVFLVVTYTLTWLLRYVIGHRRWLRATKIQSDVHGRLMERLGSSEDLLAYVQSPAGSRFLSAAPLSAEPVATSLPMAAPFARILWAVQAGLVLVSGGIGLLVIRDYVMPEVGEMLLTMGVLAISLGVGFGLAAGASFVISRRLGLIAQPGDGTSERSGGA